jgi:flagellar motor component MotA
MNAELELLQSLDQRLDVFMILDDEKYAEIQKIIKQLADDYRAMQLVKMDASKESAVHSFCAGKIAAIEDILAFPERARERLKNEVAAIRNEISAKEKQKKTFGDYREK